MQVDASVLTQQLKDQKTNFSDETETLTEMFSRASKKLIRLTLDNRALQKKFDEYHQKSEAYIKDRDEKITQLEADL